MSPESDGIDDSQDVLYRLVDRESGEVLLAAEDLRNYFMEEDREPPETVTFVRAHQVGRARRKTEQAELQVVDRQGSTIGTYYIGRVSAAFRHELVPSGVDRPDLDYSFLGYTCEYPRAGEIWRQWAATGRPVKPGEWASHPSDWHESWIHVVQTAWFDSGRSTTRYETGGTAVIDGSGFTTRDGFYCALGEAVNGPGGYFGSNRDAIIDCLRTMRRDGAAPFRLVWHNFAASREVLGSDFTESVVSLFERAAVETELSPG
ncbi:MULTISPECIES: barstar family protein [unclassified Streptomyces]|uniref:barstar family protein n=1 Tax=unclassified Streptomyces TaxID=2593676 RepID=UPI000851D6F2|nr:MULTISPECIES: barstar family protein [unclassified Streptomyces]MDX3487247.1 barstar family protein [Streptomyces sp. ID05-18]